MTIDIYLLQYDYKIIIGVYTEVQEDLSEKVDRTKPDVVLTMDEMKIKEDLVYNKHTGELVGYVNLGDIEQQLLLMEEDKKASKEVATHMLAFMVRGLCTKLDYPVAHFSTAKLSGEKTFSTVWEVIEAIEGTGCKTIAVTAHSAAQNRNFLSSTRTPQEVILGMG